MLGVAVLPVLCVRQHRPGDRHLSTCASSPIKVLGSSWEKLKCARDDGVVIQPPLKEAVRNGEPQMMPLFVCGVS